MSADRLDKPGTHESPETSVVRVWAPAAGRVELVLGEERVPMTAGEEGWWRSPGPLAPGTDYAFSLDGGPPRPDPRSPWQPAGPHGPSRVFDAGAHAWSPAAEAWRGRSALGAVLYELHLGTFTGEGTLDAAIARLDHLAELGVEMVELMPVADFPGRRGWGYDGVGLWAVHEAYGGPAALQRFVDAAHARGLAVCLDVVYNHLGPDGNHLAEFGPYFTEQHATPWGPAVNLDGEGSAAVRAFIVENALRWLRDFRIDALRLDAVHALVDESSRHLLAELADRVAGVERQVGRPLSLIAESDLNDARMVRSTAKGGRGMTAQWADDVHHALHAWLTGERHGYYVDFGAPATLAKALTRVFVHDGTHSTFRGRSWGAPVPPEVDGHRFVVFSQNHDQVGNRALGDRPSRVLGAGQLAVSAALTLLSPFTPMLFMGEEWGATTPFQYFTEHRPELGELVREGRSREFGTHGWAELYGTDDLDVPDPQSPRTFTTSRLDWAERDGDGPLGAEHVRLLDWYRTLISLRRDEPDLASGDRSATAVNHGAGWLSMTRGGVEVLVASGERPAAILWQASGHGAGEVLAAWPGHVLVRRREHGAPAGADGRARQGR